MHSLPSLLNHIILPFMLKIICILIILVLQGQMNQELVEVTDSIDNLEAFYKVQHIRLTDLPINLSDNSAEPFFIKTALDYDKYELPTVLPFDQFDLLFRPLKNRGSFKRYLFFRKLAIYKLYAAIIFLFLIIYMSRTGVDQQAISITGWIFTSLYFLLMCVSIHVQTTFFTELQNYCSSIQNQTVTVQLTNSIACFCLKDYLHFEVRSKVVEEDGKRIKLYLTKGGDDMIGVGGKEAIFQRKDLLFEEHLLGKFITFEEFQQQIRAFKDNQAYKACIFWKRSRAVLLFLTALIQLKLVFSYFGLSLLTLLVSLGIYCIIRSKESKCKSKMVQQLRTFCENVSLEDNRVQIIAHLRENSKKKCCLPLEDQLYCFEIRLKDHIHS